MFGSFEKRRRQQLKVSSMYRFVWRASGQPSQPQFSNIATPLSQTHGRARALSIGATVTRSNVGLHAATALGGSQAGRLKYDKIESAIGQSEEVSRGGVKQQSRSSLQDDHLVANKIMGSPRRPSKRENCFKSFYYCTRWGKHWQ